MKELQKCLLYKLVPKPNGKTDKIPHSPSTTSPCGINDDWEYRPYSECLRVAQSMGYEWGVALVIDDEDKLFFIDIDNCNENGRWSPLANDILARFKGCYVEVSQSNSGLHIIGTYEGERPSHRCKIIELGIELYTHGRFVALTGNQAVGSMECVATEALNEYIVDYMSPSLSGKDIVSHAWRDTPVPEWSGIECDTQLIEIMTRSRAATNVFGGKASFVDLFTANAEILGANYPPNNDKDKFDRSSADLAIAMHLAFWTGKNHDRIMRIMRLSQLVRPKWDNHKNYLRNTILKAVDSTPNVFQRAEPELKFKPVDVPAGESVVLQPVTRTGIQICTVDQQMLLFAGCVYIRQFNQILLPDGMMLDRERFDVVFGGTNFIFDAVGEKTQTSAWKVFTQSQAVQYPMAHMTCFRPELKPMEVISDSGIDLINTYVPITVPSVAGDASPFLMHLEKLLPVSDDREILISYMAACVQHIGRKFTWCPIIQGVEGNGKSLLIRVMVEAIGSRYSHLPNAKDLDNKFNAWILGKLFIGVEEIYTSERREVTEALKTLITNESIEVQKKGKDQVTTDNRANFMMCTNHKEGLPVTVDGRRYAIFYTAQQSTEDKAACGMTPEYFRALWDWLKYGGGFAVVTNYLQNYQILDKFNPATLSVEAPKTSSTEEAVRINRGNLEQSVLEAIENSEEGFTGGYISSIKLNDLIQSLGYSRMSVYKRAEMISKLGYIRHPNIPNNGRLPTNIPPEGGRPVLYISATNRMLKQLTDVTSIIQHYCKCQGYLSFGVENKTGT